MELSALQQQLREWITAPEGVANALASSPGASARLSALVRGDAVASAAERLDVYANAYFFRILECLERDFPALRRTLGEGWFRDLATAYLVVHPSTHPSLRYVGARLPRFLMEAEAAAPFRREFPWAADTAALEWALVDAFDAADAYAVSRSDLGAVPPAGWDSLCFELQPALQVVPVSRAVQQLLPEAADAGTARRLGASPGVLCVWRLDERVLHRVLDPVEAVLLGALRTGTTFGAACERLASAVGEDEAPARAAAHLGRWVNDGWVAELLPA